MVALLLLGGGAGGLAFGPADGPNGPGSIGGGLVSASTADGASTTSASQGQADVRANDQTSNGSSVVIESATLPEGGYVVITDENGDVVGHTEFLSAGTHENVEVQLDESLSEGDHDLTATVHRDTDDDQQFDYTGSADSPDGPYTRNGEPVDCPFTLTVEDDNDGGDGGDGGDGDTEGPPGDETCDDGVDNDGDGLVDDEDPDCVECSASGDTLAVAAAGTDVTGNDEADDNDNLVDANVQDGQDTTSDCDTVDADVGTHDTSANADDDTVDVDAATNNTAVTDDDTVDLDVGSTSTAVTDDDTVDADVVGESNATQSDENDVDVDVPP